MRSIHPTHSKDKGLKKKKKTGINFSCEMMSSIYTMDIAQVEFVTLVRVPLFYFQVFFFLLLYIMLCVSQLKTIVNFQGV